MRSVLLGLTFWALAAADDETSLLQVSSDSSLNEAQEFHRARAGRRARHGRRWDEEGDREMLLGLGLTEAEAESAIAKGPAIQKREETPATKPQQEAKPQEEVKPLAAEEEKFQEQAPAEAPAEPAQLREEASPQPEVVSQPAGPQEAYPEGASATELLERARREEAQDTQRRKQEKEVEQALQETPTEAPLLIAGSLASELPTVEAPRDKEPAPRMLFEAAEEARQAAERLGDESVAAENQEAEANTSRPQRMRTRYADEYEEDTRYEQPPAPPARSSLRDRARAVAGRALEAQYGDYRSEGLREIPREIPADREPPRARRYSRYREDEYEEELPPRPQTVRDFRQHQQRTMYPQRETLASRLEAEMDERNSAYDRPVPERLPQPPPPERKPYRSASAWRFEKKEETRPQQGLPSSVHSDAWMPPGQQQQGTPRELRERLDLGLPAGPEAEAPVSSTAQASHGSLRDRAQRVVGGALDVPEDEPPAPRRASMRERAAHLALEAAPAADDRYSARGYDQRGYDQRGADRMLRERPVYGSRASQGYTQDVFAPRERETIWSRRQSMGGYRQ